MTKTVILLLAICAGTVLADCQTAAATFATTVATCSTEMTPTGDFLSSLPTYCDKTRTCSGPAVKSAITSLLSACSSEIGDLPSATRAMIFKMLGMADLPCATTSSGKYCLVAASTIASAFSDKSANLPSQLGDLCDSTCIEKFNQLASAFAEIGVEGMDISSMTNLFSIACTKVDGDYCLPKFMQLASKLSDSSGSAGMDIDAVADILCSPCMRVIGRKVVDLVGDDKSESGKSMSSVPQFSQVCQKDAQGHLCLKVAYTAAQTYHLEQKCNFEDEDFNKTACVGALGPFANAVGCCAASLLPLFLSGAPAEMQTAAAALLGDPCGKPAAGATVDKAYIRVDIGNINWVAVNTNWANLKPSIKKQIADALGLQDAEITDISIIGLSRRSDPAILVEVTPASNAYSAADVATNAKTAFKSNQVTFSALTSTTYLVDPTKSADVSGNAAVNEQPSAAPALGVAVAVTAVALAVAL
eukprot:m51a1_g476 hypothetical protein (474) ;mRNA; f:198087-199758